MRIFATHPALRAGAQVLLTLVSVGCTPREAGAPGPMIVGAPSSLREAFEGVAQAFKARHPELAATVTYGSPEQLLATGAPIDLLAADSAEAMRPVAGRLASGEKRDYASNPLCLVTRAGAPEVRFRTLNVTPWALHLALADSRSDPTGMASEAALGRLGIRRAVDGKLQYLASARDVLEQVASGRSEVGLAFSTDVAAAADPSAIKVQDRVADDSRRYPIAIVTGSTHVEAARAFIDEVLHGKGPELFAQKGLLPPQ